MASQEVLARAELRWAKEASSAKIQHILGAAFAAFVGNPSAQAWNDLETAMLAYQDINKA